MITHIKGSQIEAKRIKDERTICWDASKFKPLRHVKVQQDKPGIPLIRVPSAPRTEATQAKVTEPTQTETAEPTSNTDHALHCIASFT